MSMIVNRRDIDFLMYEVFDLEQILTTERYGDYDGQVITAVLDTAQTIAEDKFLPCAAKLDANEPTFDGTQVHIIPEVAEALAAYREAGFFSASFDEAVGGMQMPFMVSSAISGIFNCANIGIADYSFLTQANASMLNAYGNEIQKALFLPPMLAGRWFGTMCLSEPQAGSSLSDIRTKAEPDGQGRYLISGAKMWISGGDHALSENIIHMVLARIPGGPAGVKGLSLFIVPKVRVNDDGSLGADNNIALAGLNHKMGHRGTTNCLLNFGEKGDCYGTLIGEPHRGLSYMFHMMNEARIAVGYGAVMSGLAGYLYSLDYARSRPQGRHPHDKDPQSPQVMIIEHADVKRMLMAQKVYVEGGLSLVTYCAGLIDVQAVTQSVAEKAGLGLLLDILTPIAKSWPSEYCLEANKHAIQVLGGYGYTREYPVERFYRDNRLNHIHEGTHGIHGIDLLGRKVRMGGGAALDVLERGIGRTLKLAADVEILSGYADELDCAFKVLRKTAEDVAKTDNINLMMANATTYLDAFGHVVVAWMWLKQGLAAQKGLQKDKGEADFYEGKLAACRYFFRYELPTVYARFALVSSLDETCLDMNPEQFVGQ
ncbi:MAG: acyl-CoA dehydrogenase [Alphaproteobacteria bacterium]|nr:MAG: acyl-CoA dehydrogenase [Alphaproteobacteria bacterium]